VLGDAAILMSGHIGLPDAVEERRLAVVHVPEERDNGRPGLQVFGPIPLLLEAEHIAGRVQAVDQVFNALALLTQCWLRLDRWDEIQARRDVWEDLEKQYPQERTGPLCWPIGLRAVVETLSGESAAGASLRDRSLDIMVATFGKTDWLRNAHY